MNNLSLFTVGNNATQIYVVYIQMPDHFSLVGIGQISPFISWEQLNSQQEISLNGAEKEVGGW